MTTKGWIIFIALIVVALGGAVYLSQQSKLIVDGVDINKIQAASDKNGQIADHIEGTGTKVTLIEYGDYQCPGCDAAAPNIRQLVDKYKDKLTFVFRNKLIPGHQNSRAAASFAEAAGMQGKYFEMNEKLYTTQTTWETLSGQARTDYFSGLITQIGGDAAKANSVVDGDAISKKIAFDDALAGKHGVTGTPTFYVNGKNVSDIYVLNGALSTKGAKDSSGNASQLIWTSAADFDTYALQPAFKDAGIQ